MYSFTFILIREGNLPIIWHWHLCVFKPFFEFSIFLSEELQDKTINTGFPLNRTTHNPILGYPIQPFQGFRHQVYECRLGARTSLLGTGVLCLLTTAPIWLLFGREWK